MFPLPMLKTIPVDLDSMDSRYTVLYHLAFMKNTILRALNNIHAHARKLQPDDPRLSGFLEYTAGCCDVLALHIHTDQRLFRAPILADVALEKLLSDGCVQNMDKVLKGANRLKKLAKKYARDPGEYNGDRFVTRLSFGVEFAARSWAQLHSIDATLLESACSEAEMRDCLRRIIASFLDQSDAAFLIPFIHSHHDRETSKHWPSISPEVRMTIPCLAKVYSRSWELAPFDVSTGRQRTSPEAPIPLLNVYPTF
ncbi:hypothetical protein F5148DRAFT_480612 [Russula earlei]|uniref:Uncharacterized protein n=1 Tax=Russula earlei TaxID=71964 RepID=A0ACC0UH79_9AGAM|nr:hypothetical protein F5148DRAFT_480612 [Russula earlei]